MRFPIDVIFLNEERRVLACKTLMPWRMTGLVWGSRGVLECPAGVIARSQTRPGDELEFQEPPHHV